MKNVRVELDTTKLDRLARQSKKKADDIVGELAFMCQGYIVENFNTESPSPPGEEPGVVTGTLKNSIAAEPVKTGLWEVHDGTEYGAMLEWGTVRMAARPFFLPAVEWTAQEAGKRGILKKMVEV